MSTQEEPKKKIRITNLTDVQSADLDRYSMSKATLAITNELLSPGETKEFDDTPQVRRDLESYARFGAVCEGDAPAAYRTAKEKAAQKEKAEDKSEKKEEKKS